MKEKKLGIGSIVYSKIGVGVITECYEGVFGDSEVLYEVMYDDCSKKFSRFKDFYNYL